MIATLLPDGRLVVPFRMEGNGVTGDAWRTIDKSDPEYEKWLPFATETADKPNEP